MKKIIIFLTFYSFSCNADVQYRDIIKQYYINGQTIIITQEATYQEVLRVDPETKEKISIKRVFSFENFAKECEMINEKPIFFAGVKEYYFAGGWPEPTYLTIFDINGNKLGIAPNFQYAKQFCKFYKN